MVGKAYTGYDVGGSEGIAEVSGPQTVACCIVFASECLPFPPLSCRFCFSLVGPWKAHRPGCGRVEHWGGWGAQQPARYPRGKSDLPCNSKCSKMNAPFLWAWVSPVMRFLTCDFPSSPFSSLSFGHLFTNIFVFNVFKLSLKLTVEVLHDCA